MTGPSLGTQAFISENPPRPERFDPPTNTEQMVHKPTGGLWTSTLRDDGSCAWLEWCRAEHWGLTEASKLYALEPEPGIAVMEIDSEYDLQDVIDDWGRDDIRPALARSFAPLDFEAIAEEYDAIHLTEWGEHHTRFTTPGLYGWDTECTLWLRWSFRSVESCGPIDTKTKELES